MLRQILRTFREAPGPISLPLLAAQLDIEPTTLDGMLQELVAMGRLTRSQGVEPVACAACGAHGKCPYVLDTEIVCYALPPGEA